MVTNFLAANLDIIDRTWSLGESLRTIYARLVLYRMNVNLDQQTLLGWFSIQQPRGS